ncbi:MAG TPA: polyketide cyclase [Rhodanobacteraceae bacterium]
MTRLLEIIVALVMVLILALIVGLLLPSSGHIQRTLTVSKDVRDVYDILDNFRRFPDYSMLRSYDANLEYQQSPDKWYGPGASISWTSSKSDAGDGKLTIVSAKPGFNQVEYTGTATIVWSIQNNWHGTDKHFTIHLRRTGSQQKLVKITWDYDVDYGWNLINRYSGLYIHGRPDTLIQYSLANLENLLATIPNIRYGDLDPSIVSTPQQPVLMISTTAKRQYDAVIAASDTAVKELQATIKKLGLHAAGPRIRFTTNFGDENYQFDVAIPVDSDTVTIDGQQYTLGAPHAPAQNADAADGSSSAGASSVAAAGSAAAPANAASAAAGPQPGTLDDHGRLIINAKVRGMLAFGGKALESTVHGSSAGILGTRQGLKAYAETHGYPFDAVTDPLYDAQVKATGSIGPDGKPITADQQVFKVYLPLAAAPAQTPEQALAAAASAKAPAAAASVAGAPASGSSAPASAGSAPAKAATVQ